MEGDPGQFTIRRMTPADKPALMAIAARIWDGTDYLPAVFDDWVADREGEFAAVLLGGRLVGCGKLTFLTPADAWFEGLRKDPDLAEKGVTTAVSAHFLRALAGRAGLRSIRFSTYVRNLASITANERMGFRRVITLSCKTWTGKREELQATRGAAAGDRGLEVRRIDDVSLAGRFLEESGYLEATRWLLPDGWRAFPYSRDLLAARYVSPGHCWGAFDGPELAGVMILVQAANRQHLYLKTVVLDAPGAQTADTLLDRLFAVARERAMGYNEIELIAPPLARVLGPCAGRGLRSWEQEEDFLVYEYPGAGR
jgi:hypothetical protein